MYILTLTFTSHLPAVDRNTFLLIDVTWYRIVTSKACVKIEISSKVYADFTNLLSWNTSCHYLFIFIIFDVYICQKAREYKIMMKFVMAGSP